MPEVTRTKAAGYHGVQNVAFAAKTPTGYASSLLRLLYAKSINPSALLEAVEQYADNRLLFRVPNDKGYEGEFGTTAPDVEFEKQAGFAIEGASGVIKTNLVAYPRGAVYYEFMENDEDGVQSVVKVWMFNVEIGKGSENHSSDAGSVEFGEYKYPFRVYGDPLKNAEGTADYLDSRGLGRRAYMYVCRPGDTGYDTFGDTVPTPKIKGV